MRGGVVGYPPAPPAPSLPRPSAPAAREVELGPRHARRRTRCRGDRPRPWDPEQHRGPRRRGGLKPSWPSVSTPSTASLPRGNKRPRKSPLPPARVRASAPVAPPAPSGRPVSDAGGKGLSRESLNGPGPADLPDFSPERRGGHPSSSLRTYFTPPPQEPGG